MSALRQTTWTYNELAANYDALTTMDGWRKEIRVFSDSMKLEVQIQQLQTEREELMAKNLLAFPAQEARKTEGETPEQLKQREYLERVVRDLPTPTPICCATHPRHAQMQEQKDPEIDRLKKVVQYMETYPGSDTATFQPPSHETDDDEMDSNSEDYDGVSEDSEDQQMKITELIHIYGKLGKSKKALQECIERGQSLRKKDKLWQKYVENLEEAIEKLKELAFDVDGNACVVSAALEEAMKGFTPLKQPLSGSQWSTGEMSCFQLRHH